MSGAAFFTAMFQSKTGDNIHLEKIGLLGVSPCLSNTVHSVAAVILFITLIVWIGFLFTGSKGVKTAEKKVRNTVYFISAGFMTIGVVCFILDCFGLFGEKFPLVWLEEVVVLLPAGFAILVKSGMCLRDGLRQRPKAFEDLKIQV
jgi:hypothetical protein